MADSNFSIVIEVRNSSDSSLIDKKVDIMAFDDEEELLDILAEYVAANAWVVVSLYDIASRHYEFVSMTPDTIMTLLDLRKFLLSHDTPESAAILKLILHNYYYAYENTPPSLDDDSFMTEIENAYNQIASDIIVLEEKEITTAIKEELREDLSVSTQLVESYVKQLFDDLFFDWYNFCDDLISRGFLDHNIEAEVDYIKSEIEGRPIEAYLNDINFPPINSFKELEDYGDELRKIRDSIDRHEEKEKYDAIDTLLYSLNKLYEENADYYYTPSNLQWELLNMTGSYKEFYEEFIQTPDTYLKYFKAEAYFHDDEQATLESDTIKKFLIEGIRKKTHILYNDLQFFDYMDYGGTEVYVFLGVGPIND